MTTTLNPETDTAGLPRYFDGGLCFDVNGEYVPQEEYLDSPTSSVQTVASTLTATRTAHVLTQRFQVGVTTGRARWVIETIVYPYGQLTGALELPVQHCDEKTARTYHQATVTRHGGAMARPCGGTR